MTTKSKKKQFFEDKGEVAVRVGVNVEGIHIIDSRNVSSYFCLCVGFVCVLVLFVFVFVFWFLFCFVLFCFVCVLVLFVCWFGFLFP